MRAPLVLLTALAATAAAAGDTQFCGGETECPQDCSYVSRNAHCIVCQCGPGPLKPGEFVVNAAQGCPPGTVLGQQLGEIQTCVPVPTPGCPHGQSYIDECDNDCSCIDGKFYGCTRKACRPDQKSQKPQSCEGSSDLPERKNRRVVCHESVVKVQDKEDPCLPGSTFKDDCNSCFCSANGVSACTEKFCLPKEEPGVCQHGRRYVDECENTCQCMISGKYSCTRRGCAPGKTPSRPLSCEADGQVRIDGNSRIFCRNGIVVIEPVSGEDRCAPGTSWKQDCNTCHCTDHGVAACTLMGCPVHVDERPILGRTHHSHGPATTEHHSRGQAALQFGDVAVALRDACPQGLREGPPFMHQKVCRGHGCEPGAKWSVNGGCSQCICTEDREPACTPCQRNATEHTVTCGDGLPSCPADCGQVFNVENNCYDCPCGTGRSGDILVSLRENCPPGTDAIEHGAFHKACAPFADLPQGDLRLCGHDHSDCPADCGLVRIAPNEGCIFCQCGPELGPGDSVVAIDDECPSPRVAAEHQFATKVCLAPNRKVCRPGIVYNVGCDICICQSNGIPACTKRDCADEKYGDLQACAGEAQARVCPADCGLAASDSYCQFCQCGPRLEEGDVVVAISEPCPPGTRHKATQFATKTCSKISGGGSQCPYGPHYIDECNNACSCDAHGTRCTRTACPPGADPEKPKLCQRPQDLPPSSGKQRVFCHEGIVKLQDKGDKCLPGSSYMDDCNACVCGKNGAAGCTYKFCL